MLKSILLSLLVTATAYSQVVMGYMFEGLHPTKVQFEKMTHIGISFIQASDTLGNVKLTEKWENIDAVIKDAHATNTKALISFGGGGYTITKGLVGSPKNRANLIKNLVAFVKKHNLDGIDMDWEPSWVDDKVEMEKINNNINNHYLEVVSELRAALDKEFGKGKKILAGAVMNANSIWYSEKKQLSHFPQNKWWDHFDWVALMNYDNDLAEKHATYESVFGENGSVAYWHKFGIPKEKIVAGIPFYGRTNWGEGWVLYSDAVKLRPNLPAAQDTIHHDKDDGQGVKIYGFNGTKTVAKKVAQSKKEGLAGVMFWQLGGDVKATHAKSLLKTIAQ
jgi:GH18 family chitinase